MLYCQECGSQVAENDTFCPYCGLTLPVAVAVDNQDVQENKSDEIETVSTKSDEFNDAPTIFSSIPADKSADNKQSETELPPEIKSQSETLVENVSEDENKLALENNSILDTESKTEFSESKNERNNDIKKPEDVETFSNLEGRPPKINSIPRPNTDINPLKDYASSDFSSTIPYIPNKIKESDEPGVLETANKPEILEEKSLFKSDTSSVSANSEMKGDLESEDDDSPKTLLHTPVFRKPHDELLPQSKENPVFVSIHPSDLICKEQTENTENSNIDDSVKSENKISDEPKSEDNSEAKISQSYTSPNLALGDTDGKKTGKLKSLSEGTVINDRYEIIRKIGGGGMGAVYLASDRNLGGVLRAVKEMVQSYIEESQQEKAINDFRRESMILSTLDHPSIPTIYDYFYDEKESRFYLVMKYINGGDLSARLRSTPEGKIDEATVVDWAIQLADVLDYLHNRPASVIYRDLKPSNVMIDGNTGRVMLIDFGIARAVKKEEKGVTAVGTMGYAPPELFSGNVEPRSDIYSLGSTMFHLLTGADPQTNPLLIFDFNKNPRPRQINPQLSDQIEKILIKSVEYSMEHRYTSAAVFRDTLKKHLDDLKAGNITYGVSKMSAKFSNDLSALNVFCGFCGQKILPADTFCPFCGAKQPPVSQSGEVSNIIRTLEGKLEIIGFGESQSSQFTLEKETNMIGRRDPVSNIFPEIDLSKFDPQAKISRRHARIWKENEEFRIEDLGSSNGTILINQSSQSMRLLPKTPHTLVSGDKIKIGDTVLQFSIF